MFALYPWRCPGLNYVSLSEASAPKCPPSLDIGIGNEKDGAGA